ncbi:DNA repair protein RecN [Avrilella dinanensis]|uniref:DNA repair protein RecN n=1 Tax=Avrilella dinanensis TaxID=2008672 RepID=UPI0024096792|nr:DNA repair protein RecN [Avrilella dinanensis]
MLTHLSIQNFTLIEKSEVDFGQGFSIITGETGAGKSILLDALQLVMGRRADLGVIRDVDNKCVIEAVFHIPEYDLKPFFEQNELEYEEETIIRREILSSGKSRAFVNDSPVKLPVLQLLAEQLIDIHSQHQTTALYEESYLLDLLDIFGRISDEKETYQADFTTYKSLGKALNQKTEKLNNLLQTKDYNTFLLQELQEADLKDGEQEELEQQLQQLQNVEQIQESLAKTYTILNEDGYGILQRLNEAKQSLQKLTGISEKYQQLFDRLNSVDIELKDLSDEVESEAQQVQHEPDTLEFITGKLQQIYRLQQKHQVKTVSELLVIQDRLNQEVFEVEDIEFEISQLEEQQRLLKQKLRKQADEIHQKREKTIPQLTRNIEEMLRPLGMPNAHFVFNLIPLKDFSASGTDQLEVLFSANKGIQAAPLKKSASGGEMSRIMLALKAILAQYVSLPTLIFDEIDTGVSGEIAARMAEIMQEIGKNRQVISITHLPQVAAKGMQHYKVRKQQDEEKAVSDIVLLSQPERVEEIASMLSGGEISESALSHAKSLLGV